MCKSVSLLFVPGGKCTCVSECVCAHTSVHVSKPFCVPVGQLGVRLLCAKFSPGSVRPGLQEGRAVLQQGSLPVATPQSPLCPTQNF